MNFPTVFFFLSAFCKIGWNIKTICLTPIQQIRNTTDIISIQKCNKRNWIFFFVVNIEREQCYTTIRIIYMNHERCRWTVLRLLIYSDGFAIIVIVRVHDHIDVSLSFADSGFQPVVGGGKLRRWYAKTVFSFYYY